MKYILLLALLGLGSLVCSQSITYEVSDFSGAFISERLSIADDDLRVEEILWEESFSDGIPVEWVNQNFDASNNLTTAVWEYRGPNTTPSNAIGSRGSCEELGTPIDSPTASDGFIIFDSNYWDALDGDCEENIGTGVSPAPHQAGLTTSSFDFTGEPYIGLELNQYLKNFNASFSIQLSIDGGEFQDIYVSDITETNAASPKNLQIRKNISELAGNQSDVRVRFYFEQMYYFWMIDDLKVVALEENNLEIITAHHGAFVSTAESVVTSFEGLDYFKYPQDMPAVLGSHVKVTNKGGVEQTNCALDLSVFEGASLVESMSSAAMSLLPDSSANFTTGSIALPIDLVDYDISFGVMQSETDESLENNTVSKVISVTESTLARDEGVTHSIYVPSAELEAIAYEVGTVYQPEVSGLELHSISTALGIGTNTDATVYATIYGIDLSTGVILDPIAISNNQFIQPYELNGIGDEQMKVIEFDEPITLYQDSSYLVAVGTSEAADQVSFAFSGESYPYTSWAKYADNTLFYLDQTPMVRMNFGIVTSVQEQSPIIKGTVYPNPTSDHVTVEYSFEKAGELTIGLFDINGRLIEQLFAGKNGPGTHQVQVDVSTIPAGVYMIKIFSEFGKLEETLIIE